MDVDEEAMSREDEALLRSGARPAPFPPLAGARYFLVISNPCAGHGRAARVLDEVVSPELGAISEALSTAVKVRVTREGGDAEAWVREAWLRDELSGVMVLGGDGTLREVIHGLCDAGRGPPRGSCPISVVPVGTDNAMCKALGVSTAHAAVATLLAGSTKYVDVMRMRPPADVANFFEEERVYSTCGIGWGVPGAIAATAEPLRGHLCLGCCRYALCGCRSICLNTPALSCKVLLNPSKVEEELLEKGACTASTRGGGVPCDVCAEQETFHAATQWLDDAFPREFAGASADEAPPPLRLCDDADGAGPSEEEGIGEGWVGYEGKFMVVGIVCADTESGVHCHLSDGTIDVQLVRAPRTCRCGILDTVCSIGCRLARAALCCASTSLRESGGSNYVYRKVTHVQVRPDECVEEHPFNVDGEIWRGWRPRPGARAAPRGARGALEISVLPSFLTFFS